MPVQLKKIKQSTGEQSVMTGNKNVEDDVIVELENYLIGFNKKPKGTYQFCCPYCHSTRKKQQKKSAYLYRQYGNYLFKCFNCQSSKSLANFLKDTFPELHRKYYPQKKYETHKRIYKRVQRQSKDD